VRNPVPMHCAIPTKANEIGGVWRRLISYAHKFEGSVNQNGVHAGSSRAKRGISDGWGALKANPERLRDPNLAASGKKRGLGYNVKCLEAKAGSIRRKIQKSIGEMNGNRPPTGHVPAPDKLDVYKAGLNLEFAGNTGRGGSAGATEEDMFQA